MPKTHYVRPRPGAQPRRARTGGLLATALAATLLLAIGMPAELNATSGAKVVVVVGPVGRLNATYKAQAREVIAEARRHTTNVVAVFTPNATWNCVRAAAAGASVFVYFGHGWGYPSRYGPYDPSRMNGMAMDPASGANGTRRVYYGEDRLRASIHLAPGAAVILYRLCYASGNTEPRLAEGTTSQSKRRIDGFGAGWLDTGAAIVLADGHPTNRANYIRQLFTTDATMWQVFRRAPNYHRHPLGPYASTRTPGARYAMDPDHWGADPSGFYRSVVGDLSLRTTQVTRRAPYPALPPAPTPSPTEPIDVEPSAAPTPSPTEPIDVEPSAAPTPSPTEPIDVEPSAAPTPSPTEPIDVEPSAAPTPSPTEPIDVEPSAARVPPGDAALAGLCWATGERTSA